MRRGLEWEGKGKMVAGERYGNFEVIDPYTDEPRKCLARCGCGVSKLVPRRRLRSGDIRSCGCLNGFFRIKHGKAGAVLAPAYSVWRSIKARCLNPNVRNFARYGGRGISLCERWMTFSNFYEDMGDPPSDTSIERIDNNKGYSPENCRWATSEEQANNRSTNRHLTVNGETRTLAMWGKLVGIKVSTIRTRLARGWSIEDALRRPIRKQHATL